MAKEKLYQQHNPPLNLGPIGHVDHRKTTLFTALNPLGEEVIDPSDIEKCGYLFDITNTPAKVLTAELVKIRQLIAHNNIEYHHKLDEYLKAELTEAAREFSEIAAKEIDPGPLTYFFTRQRNLSTLLTDNLIPDEKEEQDLKQNGLM